MKKLGLVNEGNAETYPTGMTKPLYTPSDASYVWLTFPDAKRLGYSFTQLGEHAPHHLLEGRNMPAFWVYSNIIGEQLVGEQCITLLRVVPNNAAENTPHMESLDAQYLPLATRCINSIKIKICAGPTGELVQFDSELTCILHFMHRS